MQIEAELATLKSLLSGNLRVLGVCISHSWGGLEQTAVSDAVEVSEFGIPVSFLCLEGSPTHQALEKTPGVKVHALTFNPINTLDFGLKRELDRILVEDAIDVVHAHQPTLLGSLSPWLWFHRRVALVVSRHILSSHNKRDPIHAILYKRVDALVGMSEMVKQNILATHPISAKKVHVIRLGLDFKRFDPERVDSGQFRKAWGADEGTVIIGMVGRLDPAKGQETLIKAAAGLSRVAEAERLKLKFVIVGEETLGRTLGYLDVLQRLVQQFHLEHLVHFAGFQKEIPEVMRSFDLFVMPSRQEAFGLVAIEAMAMECPTVISNGGSAEEIVGRNQEYGLLVRPEDAFDLQQKILELLKSPQKRRRMGAMAREYVKSHFDQRLRLLETLRLFSEAHAKRASH